MVDWISIDKTSGNTGTTIVTITALTYEELIARTTSLTVATDNTNLNSSITINQQPRAVETITVSPSTLSAVTSGGVYYFNIISNADWTISYPNWCTLSTTAGTGNATIAVTLSENTAITALTGSIICSTRDNSATVTLTQARAEVTISVTPSAHTFTYTGGTFDIAVTSNGPWTATTDGWITLSTTTGSGNATVTVTIPEYEGNVRNTNIYFATIDNSAAVEVVQDGTVPYLYFNPESVLFANSGGTENVMVNSNIPWNVEIVSSITTNITTNVDTVTSVTSGGSYAIQVITPYAWTASTNENWITLSKNTGKGSTNVIITLNENTNKGSIYGTITFSTINASTTVSVSVEGTVSISDYFTIEIVSSGTIEFAHKTLQYSLNGSEWTTVNGDTISVNTNDVIQIKGNNSSYGAYEGFSSTANFIIYGNIMSLVYGDNFSGQTTFTNGNVFGSLFYGCRHLNDASGLLLPATSLTDSCYYVMFCGCSSLTQVPSILPATTLAQSCYEGMFENCTSLTTAPVLPATTLAIRCYEAMFLGCTSLTTAPDLPATTLTFYCYQAMFYGCSSLNYIKCLATNPNSNYSSNWLYNAPASGTFVKKAGVNWPTGNDGIPNGWEVIDNT